MPPISIHPLSALAGAGLLGLTLLPTGAIQRSAAVQQLPFNPSRLVRVAGIPDPTQMLVIREGTPFVVPQAKLLVVTGLGGWNHLGSNTLEVKLRVDGLDEVAASIRLPYGKGTTISEVPSGFSVGAGATVEVLSQTGLFGCACGYLVDASDPDLVRVAGIPDPRAMVVIREGLPFVVPAGKALAITGLGAAAGGTQATLRVDGGNSLVAIGNWSVGSSCSVCPTPPGIAAGAGATVAVDSGTSLGRAWGYLVDR